MTKEKREQISNRLVLNFGVLLAGALVLLYVRSALSTVYASTIYSIIFYVGVLALILSVVFFILGKKKGTKLKNYSGVPFGVFVATIVLYISRDGVIKGYRWEEAVSFLYILMAVYFIVMSVITSVLLRKPVIKENAAKPAKKRKRK